MMYSEDEYRDIADAALDKATRTTQTDRRESFALLSIAATMAADAMERADQR